MHLQGQASSHYPENSCLKTYRAFLRGFLSESLLTGPFSCDQSSPRLEAFPERCLPRLFVEARCVSRRDQSSSETGVQYTQLQHIPTRYMHASTKGSCVLHSTRNTAAQTERFSMHATTEMCNRQNTAVDNRQCGGLISFNELIMAGITRAGAPISSWIPSCSPGVVKRVGNCFCREKCREEVTARPVSSRLHQDFKKRPQQNK